jgi:hypothetical protein
MQRRQFLAAGLGLAVVAPRSFAASTAQIEILPDDVIGVVNPDLYSHFTEHLGGCIYDGIWVGEKSKIPNVGGIRKELVDRLKELKPPVIRWPGGCFADSYDWRDGVGPREKRPKRTNFWADTPYMRKAPAKIICYIQIRPTVIVEVAPGRGEAESVVVLLQSHRVRYILKMSTPVLVQAIPEQEVGGSVLGIVIGRRIGKLRFTLEVDIATEIQIQTPVAIVVCRRHAGEPALRRCREGERLVAFHKAVAVIQEQQGTGATKYHQILTTNISQIEEQRTRCFIQKPHTPSLSDVMQLPVAPPTIESIGQSAGLANIDFVLAVTINVADGNPVAAINVDAQCRIQSRSPVRHAAGQLLGKSDVLSKGRGCYIAK